MTVELIADETDPIVRAPDSFGWKVPVQRNDEKAKIFVEDGFLGQVVQTDASSVERVFQTIAARIEEQVQNGTPLRDVRVLA